MAAPNYEFQGIPDETARFAVTDTVQQFTSSQYTRADPGGNNRSAIAVVITCETEQVRFTLGGSTPTQGAAGLGHILYVGQSIRLSSPSAVRSFSYINHTNLSNGVLQATFEFEPGR